MASHEFVHLHLHTHYSVLDGLCLVNPLLNRAKELGYKSLAITDHGTMFGAMDFYTNALKTGVKPIIGIEAYVAAGSRHDRHAQGMKEAGYHLVLLAKNYNGYKNLIKLSSAAYVEGFYYRPRMDRELLEQYKDDIIVLSACLGGEVPQKLMAGKFDEACETADWYRQTFGADNYFIEIQDNGMREQQELLPTFRKLSKHTGIPLVATSDVHYINPVDAKAHDVLLCINTGKRLTDEKRMRMETQEFYLKSPEQMRLLFKEFPDACDNTLAIAERCNVQIEKSGFHLPSIEPPEGITVVQYLQQLVTKGLLERYGTMTPEIDARAKRELDVIIKMGFPSYFLIVWDLVNFAKTNNIPVGPGRGSAAGSIVAYALRITDLDPLKYDLLFERFLNEGRNEMPDIDLDFCQERRGEVVDYIIQRHGREQCAQIVTFGRLSAKSAIRDVARVLDVPLKEADAIAKLVPDMLKPKGGKTTVDLALEQNPDLAELYKKDAQTQEILDIAKTLDYVIRQTGKHAAGVVISDKPVIEYCPLARRGDDITTQWEMKTLEKLGMCKIDVLGLETLTIIKKAINNILNYRGESLDISSIPVDDPAVFELICSGRTKGVFQFEGEGFTKLLVRLLPDCFEDLIAAVAMYRPGPLGCGMVDSYIDCKHGRAKPEYLHPLLEPILKETHGLILYQEQVQRLALNLAHFSLSEGDLLRRAMGKKDPQIMADYREAFMKQAHDTCGSEIAGQIFDQIEYFAGYGFNKSHSACYAYVAYQTAYLKAHYPREFMAALLTLKMNDTKRVVEYMEECRQMGFEVFPPDINESSAEFTVVDKNLRFGLAAVKGVGFNACETVVTERQKGGPFTDLYSFCERIDLSAFNKGCIEALIKAGAFDAIGTHRAALMTGVENAIRFGQAAAKSRAQNQMSLFSAASGNDTLLEKPTLPDVPEWTEEDKLKIEKEVTGFYISGHPLKQHRAIVERYITLSYAHVENVPDKSVVTIGGIICGQRLLTTKKGDRFARITLEDLTGVFNVIIWPRTYEACKDLLGEDSIIFVQGKLEQNEDGPEVFADTVIPLDEVVEKLSSGVCVNLKHEHITEETMTSLGNLVRTHRGECPLFFNMTTANGMLAYLRAGNPFSLRPSNALTKDLESLFGKGTVTYQAN